MSQPTTLGELKESGWQSVSVKHEIRRNAIRKIRAGEDLFPGIWGYEDTVIPQLETALLAGHDVIFLGERGQAKTPDDPPGARPARRVDPHRGWLRDQRRSLQPGVQARQRPDRRRGRQHPVGLGAPQRALRGEAGHPPTPPLPT